MMSLERDDGSLQLLAHQFIAPEHLIEDAHDLVKKGTYPGATILVDAPLGIEEAALEAVPVSYRRPEPRKARL